MKAVIYARYSSERQTEQSIEGQLRECKDFAKKNDITIVGTYVDRAISAKTDNRPDFQRMIKDSDRKFFDAVLVYKLDRFARNRYDSAIYRAKLKRNGIRVLSAKENITDAPEGIILESMLEGMAEYYSAELSQKVKRGMKESALKCKSTGGQRTLGYKINVDKTFEIDIVTAPTVQRIFEMYASGSSINHIVEVLNGDGLRTAKNIPFTKYSIPSILRNKKYIGVYNSCGLEIENGIPAIIEKDLFERVQIMVEATKRSPAKAKSTEFALSGKVQCGKCGATMIGESGTGHNHNVYYYYKCTNRKKGKKCNLMNVKKDWLEELVINTTVNDVLQDDVIQSIAKHIVELLEYESTHNDILLALQENLKDVEKKIKNMLNAIEQGIITESTKNRLFELQSLKDDLQLQITKQEVVTPRLTEEQIIFWLEKFKDGEINDPDYRRELINTFINNVFVYEDKIILAYNYSDNHNKATIRTVQTVLEQFDSSDLTVMVGVGTSNPNYFVVKNVFGLILDLAA